MKEQENKSIIVVSWDGINMPLHYLLQDTTPNFDLFIFDYSGNNNQSQLTSIPVKYYHSQKTECKGDILQGIYNYCLQHNVNDFKYMGILDDDICISISDLNKLLFTATIENLDVFQASLTQDSYYHHRQFIHKPGYQILNTDWVEIMAPFYSSAIFFEAGKNFNRSISGTGIDVYLIPTVQRLLEKTNTAVVHAVQMKHCRPIRTDNRVFSNGKTNLIEIKELQKYCLEIIYNNPAKFEQTFIDRVIKRNYVYGIPLKYKLKRIPLMLKNFYHFLVDASYR